MKPTPQFEKTVFSTAFIPIEDNPMWITVPEIDEFREAIIQANEQKV